MNLVNSSLLVIVISLTHFAISVSNASEDLDNKPKSITLHELLKDSHHQLKYQSESSARDKRGFVYVPDRGMFLHYTTLHESDQQVGKKWI